MNKRKIRLFVLLLLCVLAINVTAGADRVPQEKPKNYIGAMRVVWCKEWISLREEPKKTSNRLAEIPLGAIVYNCVDIGDPRFYECEYEGQKGYALIGYLWGGKERVFLIMRENMQPEGSMPQNISHILEAEDILLLSNQ